MTVFDAQVVDAVTAHMNGDHNEDNLLIARAFGAAEATQSVMVSLDAEAGVWLVTDPSGEHELRVAWPAGTISERTEIRREVVSLYQAACGKLGVTPREEHGGAQQASHTEDHGRAKNHGHGANPHAGNPHGQGGSHPHAHDTAGDDGSFSHAIRTATWGDHGDSEGQTIMEDIVRMRGTREDYISLVVQHHFMYEALEKASEQLGTDPRFAELHPATLVREAALTEDLELLLGEDWREKIEPLPATKAYADRINEISAEGWLPGIVAHHYTRYLGDLSGGQMIAKRVKQQFGFERAGVAFYDFTELGDIDAFKHRYRVALDALGESLSEQERSRMIDEIRAAYRFNTAVFADMQLARNDAAA